MRLWQLYAACAAIGVLGGAGIILGTTAIDDLRDEREARTRAIVRQERRYVERRTLDRREVAAIARRIARVETPTRADLLRLIRDAAATCEESPRAPACVRAARAFGGAAPISVAGTPPAARTPSRRTGAGSRPHRRPPTTRPDPARPRPEQPAPTTPTTPFPPPTGRPPVDVQTPPDVPLPRPTICAPILGGINCP